jgi:hypothetical protein
MVHRSAGSQILSVDADGFDAAGNGSTSENENPARAEADIVVSGGTNALKEFPG